MTKDSAMKRALAIARKVKGKTGNNPAVGAVIFKNGKIIAEGFTHLPGHDHAEKDALKRAGNRAKNGEMAVTLEPCCHFGRTPPCTRAIIEAGIKKCYVALKDPNSLMAGKGIAELKRNGISVECGICQEEAREINGDFFKYIKTGIPFVALKAAITLNGMVAASTGDSRWITSLPARKMVHKLRSEYDAILVGMKTVIADDPELNVRLCKGRNPVRIIVSGGRDLPKESKIVKSAAKIRTILMTTKEIKQKVSPHVEYIHIPSTDNKLKIPALLRKIGSLQIKSLLVEGGSSIHTAFIAQKAFDFIYLFTAPRILENGIPLVSGKLTRSMAEALNFNGLKVEKIGEDFLFSGKSPFNRN